jgi:hypothetical protein
MDKEEKTEMSIILNFIVESFAIEGLNYHALSPSQKDNVLNAHTRFFQDDPLTLDSLKDFVAYVEPKAQLRTTPGQDVTVAEHVPMRGGEQVKHALIALLQQASTDRRPRNIVAFDYYWRYLYLHPFTDCNGRSARALWAHLRGGIGEEGFLAQFHYNALTWQDSYRPVEDRPVSPNFADES